MKPRSPTLRECVKPLVADLMAAISRSDARRTSVDCVASQCPNRKYKAYSLSRVSFCVPAYWPRAAPWVYSEKISILFYGGRSEKTPRRGMRPELGPDLFLCFGIEKRCCREKNVQKKTASQLIAILSPGTQMLCLSENISFRAIQSDDTENARRQHPIMNLRTMYADLS
ncbi:hypothetical protein EVAR_92887_1 [Eumeta japonica]|uniref:Uncharacterized protein n=1 Tax=Eumeta variegata TaxID=151549 RepID=A0A4C1TD92_EUMVA|nr:hypothetical protein EVAR_92887_1 [Eumeta japonica]